MDTPACTTDQRKIIIGPKRPGVRIPDRFREGMNSYRVYLAVNIVHCFQAYISRIAVVVV